MLIQYFVLHSTVTKVFLHRHLDITNYLKQYIMKTLDYTTNQENKKKVIFVNFTNTRRLQWDKYRRFA